MENTTVKDFNAFEYLLFIPTDWKEEAKPWSKCKLKKIKDNT